MRFSVFLLLFFPLSSSYYYSKDVLDDYFFEGVSEEFVDWYANFTYVDETFDTILTESKFYSYYIAFPSVFLITFHLVVLTRKSLMTSSTNILLLVITIGDLGYLLFEVLRYLNTKYEQIIMYDNWTEPNMCIPPLSWTAMVGKRYFEVLRNYLNRVNAWSGLLLAAVRSMVVWSSTTARSVTLTSPTFGWRVTATIFMLCLLTPIIESMSYNVLQTNTWTSGPTCRLNKTLPIYGVYFNNNFPISQSAIAWGDSVLFQFIPSILIVYYTALLVVELWRARKRSMALGAEGVQSTKITLLVLLIAISFVFVRILQALVTILTAWTAKRLGFLDVVIKLPNLVNLSFTINAILHFVICVCLSSQYRNTVKKMFGENRRESGTVNVQAALVGVGMLSRSGTPPS